MPKPKFRPKASGQVGFSAIGLQLSPGDREARDPAPTFAGNGRWQLPTGEKSFLAWFGSGARRAVQAEQGGRTSPLQSWTNAWQIQRWLQAARQVRPRLGQETLLPCELRQVDRGSRAKLSDDLGGGQATEPTRQR
jgi:hypothetical protein